MWLHGSGFHSGVRGFLTGLPSGSDWIEVRDRLTNLLPRRLAKTKSADPLISQEAQEQGMIDLSVARAWAMHDLERAVDWYARELTSDGWLGATTPRILDVLAAVPEDELFRVTNWVESNRNTNGWDDQIVVEFLARKTNQAPNAEIARLVSIPAREKDRAYVVASFVEPAGKGGELTLRHAPDVLKRLIGAANLSAAETERWLQRVDALASPDSQNPIGAALRPRPSTGQPLSRVRRSASASFGGRRYAGRCAPSREGS